MDKNEIKKVVDEAIRVVSEERGKKVLKTVGAASIVAGVTLVCRGVCKKLKNNRKCKCKPEKMSDKEIAAALDYLKSDEQANTSLNAFGVDAKDITAEDVIVNDGRSLILKKDIIFVCLNAEGSGTFRIRIYVDPLYDLIMTQD